MTTQHEKPKFDTCFFERYAKAELVEFLGPRYANLVNRDRPDLQDDALGLGIEVTRAMHESKKVANAMINDMAGDAVVEVSFLDRNDIITYGYNYGLDNRFVGRFEYDYWALALPLQRIIESKVRKVGDGFYGQMKEFGLFVFSKEQLSHDDIWRAIEYTAELQSTNKMVYKYLYISQSNEFFACDLRNHSFRKFDVSIEQRRKFYKTAIADCMP